MLKKLILILGVAWVAHGAGTVQQSVSQLGTTNNWVVAMNWTGDQSNGSVSSTPAQLGGCCQGYLVVQVEMVPKSPAPTNGYSVQITDAAGVDVLGGAAASLSSTTPQAFAAAASAPPTP